MQLFILLKAMSIDLNFHQRSKWLGPKSLAFKVNLQIFWPVFHFTPTSKEILGRTFLAKRCQCRKKLQIVQEMYNLSSCQLKAFLSTKYGTLKEIKKMQVAPVTGIKLSWFFLYHLIILYELPKYIYYKWMQVLYKLYDSDLYFVFHIRTTHFFWCYLYFTT